MEEFEEEIQKEESVEQQQALTTQVKDFSYLIKKGTTKADIFTNITSEKKIFNLESKVDCLLNDCEGELIRVKEVLIKRFEKPLEEPILNEETGEILKDKKITMSCILIDDNNKSYATGSKIFTIQMIRYINMFRNK